MISIYLLPDCLKGGSTVWATGFSVAQTVKSVAQTVSPVWAPLFFLCLERRFAARTVKLL